MKAEKVKLYTSLSSGVNFVQSKTYCSKCLWKQNFIISFAFCLKHTNWSPSYIILFNNSCVKLFDILFFFISIKIFVMLYNWLAYNEVAKNFFLIYRGWK